MSAVERFTGNASAIPWPSSGATVAGRRMASSDERSGSARFGRVLTAARAETNALPAGRPTLAPLDDRLDPSGLIRDRSRQPHRPLAQKRTDPTIGNEADEEGSGTSAPSTRSAQSSLPSFTETRDETEIPTTPGIAWVSNAPEPASAGESESDAKQGAASTSRSSSGTPPGDAAAASPPTDARFAATAKAALGALANGDQLGTPTRFVVTTADLGRVAFITRRDGATLRIVVELERSAFAVADTVRAELAAIVGARLAGARISVAFRPSDESDVNNLPSR